MVFSIWNKQTVILRNTWCVGIVACVAALGLVAGVWALKVKKLGRTRSNNENDESDQYDVDNDMAQGDL